MPPEPAFEPEAFEPEAFQTAVPPTGGLGWKLAGGRPSLAAAGGLVA